jgi:hypothetical protein
VQWLTNGYIAIIGHRHLKEDFSTTKEVLNKELPHADWDGNRFFLSYSKSIITLGEMAIE